MALPSSVVFIGDLDIAGCAAIREALDSLQGPAVVDMRNVRYLDAAALREFAHLAARIGPGRVTLVVAPGNVRRLLRLVSFEKLFTIVDVVRPARIRALPHPPASRVPRLSSAAPAESDGS